MLPPVCPLSPWEPVLGDTSAERPRLSPLLPVAHRLICSRVTALSL